MSQVSRAFRDRRYSVRARVTIIVTFITLLALLWLIPYIICFLLPSWTLFAVGSVLLSLISAVVLFAFFQISQQQKFKSPAAGFRLGFAAFGATAVWAIPALAASMLGMVFQHQFLIALVFAALVYVGLLLVLPFAPIWMFERYEGEIYIRVPFNTPEGTREYVRRDTPPAQPVAVLMKELAMYGIPMNLMKDFIEFGVPEHMHEQIAAALDRHLDERELKITEQRTDQAVIQRRQQGKTPTDEEIATLFQTFLAEEQAKTDEYEAKAHAKLDEFFRLTKVDDVPVSWIAAVDQIDKVWELTTRIFSKYTIEHIPTKDGPQFTLNVEFGAQFNPVRAKDVVLIDKIRKSVIDATIINEHIKYATLNQLQKVVYGSFSSVPLQEVHLFAIQELADRIVRHLQPVYDSFGVTMMTPTIICQPIINEKILKAYEDAALAQFIGRARNAEFWDMSKLIQENPHIQHLIAMRYVRSVRLRGDLAFPQYVPPPPNALPGDSSMGAPLGAGSVGLPGGETQPVQSMQEPTTPFTPIQQQTQPHQPPESNGTARQAEPPQPAPRPKAPSPAQPQPPAKPPAQQKRRGFRDYLNNGGNIIPTRRDKDGVYRPQLPDDEDDE